MSVIEGYGKSCCERLGDAAIVGLTYAGLGLAVAIAVVASPILGPLGAIACLFKAAYDGYMINHHWRHSREKDGNGDLIEGTEANQDFRIANFRNKDASFKLSDLERLQHELARRNYVQAATEDLRWARGLAKYSIPVIGLFWAFFTEAGANGSFASIGCDCCMNGAHVSDERWLQYQIDKLEGKNPNVPVSDY